jgi:hypothetical protein
MKLNFYKANELDNNIKATVHKTGKLGFNSAAIQKLNLENNRKVRIATGDDYEKDKSLYIIPHNDEDKESFNISKAGEYYYINTKPLFDLLGIEYENIKIAYDIIETNYDDIKIFKLKRRKNEQKRDEKEDLEE